MPDAQDCDLVTALRQQICEFSETLLLPTCARGKEFSKKGNIHAPSSPPMAKWD
jgi:hypothetical protein